MRIYDINPADGTLIDPAGREAPRDPMRQTPRVPAGATSVAPPNTGDHEAARWTGESWEAVPDWRGHVYWTEDGERHEITELGVEPPADALSKKPEPEPLTPEEELAQWRETASVTRRQAKQALLMSGLLSSVQSAIDAIEDETERGMVQIFWDDSTTFERNNPQLIALGEALGLTEEQIDDLFVQASEL